MKKKTMKIPGDLSDERLAKFGNEEILSERELLDACSHLESCEDCLVPLEAVELVDDPLIRRLRVPSPNNDRRLVDHRK